MSRTIKGRLPEQEEKYLAALLDLQDLAGQEMALERLCKWYRRGFVLIYPYAFRQRFNSLLYSRSPKVVRWAFNAIALVGKTSDNLIPALDAIQRHSNDKDVLAAGAAAVLALAPKDDAIARLKKIGIPFEGAPLLAIAQNTTEFLAELTKNPIRPDKADASELRLATVLVGLNRAPENLFEPRHSNAEIVGVLNGHDDNLVAQYSVWAICENPTLTLPNLRIDLLALHGREPNIRGWVYQLISSEAATAKQHLEHIRQGSLDKSEKARLGLATGLRNTYFDGLEEITSDWIAEEDSEPVRQALLEHMAANGEKLRYYEDVIRKAYEDASSNSVTRMRLEAASQGTEIYGKLKVISFQNNVADLFSQTGGSFRGITMNQNISGNNVNIGTVSGTTTTVSGSVYANQNISQVKEHLAALTKLLENEAGSAIDDGRKIISEVQLTPTKSGLQTVLDWMKALKNGANYVVAMSSTFGDLYDKLNHLLSILT